jgi:hypothetical protein
MNKIDQLKKVLVQYSPEISTQLKNGFQACFDLKLPILFTNWISQSEYDFSLEVGMWFNVEDKTVISTEDLFNKWFNEIYNPPTMF